MRVIKVTLQVLNDPEENEEWTPDEDIEPRHIYCSYELQTQDWELEQEIEELADAIDRIMGAR